MSAPLSIHGGVSLPGLVPDHVPERELEISSQMEVDMARAIKEKGSDSYDCYYIANIDLRHIKRGRKPRLVVQRAAHVVRSHTDTGIQHSTVDDGSLAVQYIETAIRAREHLGILLEGPHSFCRACYDALNYFCEYLNAMSRSESKEKWVNCVVHHFNLISLSISAKCAECYICRLIMKFLSRQYATLANPQWPSHFWTAYQIEMYWPASTRAGEAAQLEFNLVDPTKAKWFWNSQLVFGLDIWPKSEYSSNFSLPGPLEALCDYQCTMNSLVSRNLARKWLSQCVNNDCGRHSRCHLNSTTYIPTRLLDVATLQETGLLRIVETNNDPTSLRGRPHYLTLSHCWGSSSPPKLISTNLKIRQASGIAIESLPQTFRDAVEITRWFDIEWLWIDCLCIIQDLEEDWIREASLMAQTYRYAFLNISADGSADSGGGCFHNREPSAFTAISMTARNLGESWYVTPESPFLSSNISKTPTFRRAWIYRERQISRRILHFSAEEMWWECCGNHASCFASDMFPGGAPFNQVSEASEDYRGVSTEAMLEDDGKFNFVSFNESLPEESRQKTQEIHDSWNELCEMISTKDLTVPGDLPMVLSSLAEDFSTLFNGKDGYAAGMWQSTLPGSLAWAVRYPRNDRVRYRAPSWSWLSAGVPVWLTQTKDRYGTVRYDVMRIKRFDLKSKYSTTLYGPLRRGAIIAKGCMRRVQLEFNAHESDDLVRLSVFDTDSKSSLRVIGFNRHQYHGDLFNVQTDDNPPVDTLKCFCFFIAISQLYSKSGEHERELTALLLQPRRKSARKNSWKRIGMMTLNTQYALQIRYEVVRDEEGRAPTAREWKEANQIIDNNQAEFMERVHSLYYRRWEASNGVENADTCENHEFGASIDAEGATTELMELMSAKPDPSLLYAFDEGLVDKRLRRLRAQTITML